MLSVMEELQARFLVLIENRKTLAAVAAREHREWTPEELAELAKLNSALDAIRYTINELTPSSANATPSPPVVDPDYRLQAAAFRDVNRDNLKFAMDQVGQSGRWLLATIGASHFGGLLLLTQLTGKVEIADLRPAMWSLVSGLVLILISGLVTYWNWSAAAQVYSKNLGPGYLVDKTMWPTLDPKDARRITFTQRTAIIVGFVSVLCLIPAVYFVAAAHIVPPAP